MDQLAQLGVKIIDVRTPEEFAFVGHPAMAWNVPFAFVSYQRSGGKFTYAPQMNKAFVDQVKETAGKVGHRAQETVEKVGNLAKEAADKAANAVHNLTDKPSTKSAERSSDKSSKRSDLHP